MPPTHDHSNTGKNVPATCHAAGKNVSFQVIHGNQRQAMYQAQRLGCYKANQQ
jgi:hypothetical protein